MKTTYHHVHKRSSLLFTGVYLLSFFLCVPVWGQVAIPITLEKVLELSGANNLTVKEYELKYQQALAEQSKAKEWWLPNIYVGATTHFLNGAAMNSDGHIFTKVDRNNFWAGLGIAADIDFSNGLYQSAASKQQARAANYFSIAKKNNIILKAINAYFDLQSAQLQYIFLRSLVNQSDSLSQQIKIQVDGGLLYQSEYLLSRSNFQHLNISMLQAKAEWQRKSALLANLLNVESGIRLISVDTTLAPVSFTAQPTDTSGFKKRPEYAGLTSELQSFQTLRKTANMGLLMPKLRIGFDNGPFRGYATPFYNTYQFNASLLWNIPFGRLTYKGDIKKYNTKILLRQNEIEQFKNQYRQEVSTATSQLQIGKEQMAVGEQALQLAAEAVRQSIARQKLGTAKAFEVFQAQQFFLQAQIDYLKAIVEYNKAQFALKVAQGEAL